MSKQMITRLALALAIAAVATKVDASWGGWLDLDRDMAKADLICTGQVVATGVGTPDAKGYADFELTFLADRVAKGEVKTGDRLRISVRSNVKMPITQLLSGYILVLLRRVGDSYEFAFSEGTMRVAQDFHLPYARSSDVKENLRWEVLNSLKDTSKNVIQPALRQTGVLLPSDVTQYVEPYAKHPDLELAVAAMCGLAKAGRLRAGLEFLEQRSDSELAAGPAAQVRACMSFSKPAPQDVPVLGRLIQSKSVVLRRLASQLLRYAGDVLALSYLKSALDDPDQRIRYNAVMGLAETTKDFAHGPAYSLFQADEAKYLNYWKNWQPPQDN